MASIIVSVRRFDENLVRDLEVPLDVRAVSLVGLICEGLEWDVAAIARNAGGVELRALAPNGASFVVPPNQTLGENSISNGDFLIVEPAGQRTVPTWNTPRPQGGAGTSPPSPSPGGGYRMPGASGGAGSAGPFPAGAVPASSAQDATAGADEKGGNGGGWTFKRMD